MKDKDTIILEEYYKNIYIKENVNVFTPQEIEALRHFASEVEEQERNDKDISVNVETAIDDTNANFHVTSKYAVDTQRGTMHQTGESSVGVEKVDDNFYYVVVNDEVFEVTDFNKVMSYLKDNL